MKKLHQVRLPQVKRLAKKVAWQLTGGEVMALVGPLGSGKTAFAKALAKQLKVRHKVTSPTFTLMHAFDAKLKNGRKTTLLHLDLYRTKNAAEVRALGINEVWGRKDTLTLIEWADKIKKYLPKKTIYIYFSH